MDKQIEEMAKCLDGCPYLCEGIGGNKHNGDLKIAEYLYNAGYCKIPEGAVVLTDKEYKRYERIEKIIKLAKREKASGYEVKNGKLYYFSNLWEGFEYEFKDLQEICDTANHYDEEFFELEERLAFWQGKAEEVRKETAGKFAKRLKGHLKESYHNLYHAEYRGGMVSINLDTLIENIDEICKELVDEKIKALESDNDDKTINS